LLKQAFNNLLSNALKYTRKGEKPVVSIEARAVHGRVRFTFRDSGIGIAAEHHARIFDVFQRLHSQAEYPGTGIGLAIVRRAAERMEGSAGVESASGQGSRFWIELKEAE
jgi:signal transduction histidine kinase